MHYELISESDYDALPADPLKKFVVIEQICRRNMTALITNETPGQFDDLVRTQYMTIVCAAAEELGIQGLDYQDSSESVFQNLQEFLRQTSGVVAKIRLRSSSKTDAYSVRLANKTKGIIEHELGKIRSAVSNGDLDERKKQKLLSKIEEFRTELHKERLGYSVAMSALAIIGAGLVGTSSFLADAPDAITIITKLIGQDKEHEESEVLRLGGPATPKVLAAPAGKTSRVPTSRAFDDDIPF
ncbi:hypothetical protein HFO45_23035 [Rhizobium leguminosarum]|uniref:hypothetical protein n=1 Tax=Rhizobium TaxID=379 RepID=UPI001C900CA2|nr:MULTISPECIES: hypothetical protein [Rhizobium]MBY3225314.1 hypothetical protein [Rhizobium laguerreae]MBY5651105.1 hypothetical protein [Rhizobium leguminosarum]